MFRIQMSQLSAVMTGSRLLESRSLAMVTTFPPAEAVSVDTDSAALAVSADASVLSVLPELPHPVIIIAAAMNSAIHLVFLLIIFLLVFLL